MKTKTKTTLLATITLLACSIAWSAGLYFVSGSDFKQCDLAYVVQTTEPNQTVDISPVKSNIPHDWYVKTEGVELYKDTSDTTTPIMYTYANPGLHTVKLYPGYTTSGSIRWYTFHFNNENNGEHIKKIKTGSNATIAFDNTYCSGLKQVIFNGSRIIDYAIRYSSNVVDIVISPSVVQIGGACFQDCTSITNIYIPNTVLTTRNFLCWNCTSLKTAHLSENMDQIPMHTFRDCPNLEQVDLPIAPTNIGAYAFSNCTNLPEIAIADGVVSIGAYAFQNCKKFKGLTIPASVITIDKNAFNGMDSITNIVFVGKTPEEVQAIKDSGGNNRYPWGMTASKIITQ